MSTSSPLAVAYLDILGFRSIVQEDRGGAAQVLSDYNDALSQAIADTCIHPIESYREELRELAEGNAVTSFLHFLPMSDSIFVISANPSLLVVQLAVFLRNSFGLRSSAFANTNDGHSDIRDQSIAELSIPSSQPRTSCERWYPLLFRGGLAIGRVSVPQIQCIIDGAPSTARNVFGEAVVEAVALEDQAGDGPTLRCSEAFRSALQGNSQEYVTDRQDGTGAPEILWPMAWFRTQDTWQSAWQDVLVTLLHSALNLWARFRSSTVERHYWAFVQLLLRSALHRYAREEEAIRADVLRAAGAWGLTEHALFPDVNLPSGEE